MLRDWAHISFSKRILLKNDAELLAVAPNFEGDLDDFASFATLIWP